jgi:DNA mismatch repair ATPase MutS
LINSDQYHSGLLSEIQQKVRKDGLAELHIHELEHIIAAFDVGNSQIGLLVFNSLLLWNVRYAIRLQRWYARYGKEIPGWFESIAHFDALSSLATFAFNNPEYIYPVPVEAQGHFSIHSEGVGHPFIASERCVCNDFSMDGKERFVIVTGANMAGKSTFLRTLGINLVMGMSGLPVFARNMTFTPIALYTNMRTTDSLVNEESYFFAELKRLRYLLDLLEQGIPLFVILDEILRGTNSIDKLSGSRGFVRRLMNYPCSGLIATHDLKLTEIATEYEGKILTKCFEIQLSDAGLHFDYLLTPGVTQTMNATFLMKKMGIIDSED